LLAGLCHYSHVFLTGIIVRKKKCKAEQKKLKPVNGLIKYTLLAVLIFCITYLNAHRHDYKNAGNDRSIEQLSLEGFSKTCFKTDIYQFKSPNALVYVKASCQFYGADHNPLICWEGSGYQFNNVSILDIGEEEVYVTKLTSPENETLFTAWWFDNGSDKTISQLEWRWKMIHGANAYRLVNVTAEDIDKLEEQCSLLLKMNLFRQQ
jgi:exosortase N